MSDVGAPPALAVDIRGLSVMVRERALVDDVSLSVVAGTTTAVIGPNGSGKTTLLRTLYRAWKPTQGTVWIGDHDAWSLPPAQAAKLRAVVTQHQGDGVGFTGREVASMARYLHRGRWERESASDHEAVDAALHAVEAEDLSDRVFAEMSGGERQRILVARALAQHAPVVLLDEPTNHLDVRAQFALLRVLRSAPATTLIALHDVNHALAYADQVAVLSHGRLVAYGAPTTVITPSLLREVFGVDAVMTTDPFSGSPHAILGGDVL